MLISLEGKNGTYQFDPNDEANVIKTSHKFFSLYRGTYVQGKKAVTIKHFKDPSLIKDENHEVLLLQIFLSMNVLHSGIAQTYDLIRAEAGYFLVREYFRGVDLKTITLDPDYPNLRNPVFMLKVGIKVCEILSKLHESGIIHRNIKPSNIFVEYGENGKIDEDNINVKIVDFEYAQIKGLSLLNFAEVPFSRLFSPPELILGKTELVNETSDVFSLGISLYEIVARKPAFYHSNPEMLVNIQLNNKITKAPRIPKELFPILLKATSKHKFPIPPDRYKPENLIHFLAKGRDERHKSMEELKQELLPVLELLIAKEEKRANRNFIAKFLFG